MENARQVGRRGLLAGGLGALVAGLLGKVSSASAADGEPLFLGNANSANQTTELDFGGTGGAVQINWGDQARAIIGDGTHNGTAIYGELVPAVQRAPWRTASAGWFTGGVHPGAVGISDEHIGVIGLSGPVKPISPEELDPAGGHFVGAGGAGLCARSDSNPGALGMSDGNVGLVGATGVPDASEDELYDLQPAGVWGVGGGAPGVIGSGQIGCWGLAPGADVSLNPQPLPPTGIWGQGGRGEVGVLGQGGIGMWGAAPSVELNPQPFPPSPTGVWGQGGAGEVGVLAVNGDGHALEVQGRAAYSGVGHGTLDRHGNGFVSDPGIGASSHVIVTLQGDPGQGAPWVEIQPGKGFMVHMTGPAKASVPFSYLVLDAREAA